VRSILSVTLAAAALAAAAAFAQSSSASASGAVRNPTLSDISRYVSFQDSTLRLKRAAGFPFQTWDFAPTTETGETVRIHLSRTLFLITDSAVAQRWADFFDSLVHGSELSTLDVYLMTLREVQSQVLCGSGALACYAHNEIVAPAQDPAIDLSAEAVVTHEYGHHVAAHRQNDPWDAIDYGTKRWASYENVCLKTRKHVYFPGDESEAHYFENPGEGFAEAYRVMNQRLLGQQEAPWDIVTQAFYPDDSALALLQQDVTTPWTKNTTLSRSGSVSASAKSRAFVVSTPLDGRLSVRLTSSAKAKFRLDVLSPNAVSIGHSSGKNASASATVCGERAVRLRVNRVTGAGAFKLAISRP
jgi:hypothetical protein